MIDHLKKSFSESLDNLCNYLEHTTEYTTPPTNTRTTSHICTKEIETQLCNQENTSKATHGTIKHTTNRPSANKRKRQDHDISKCTNANCLECARDNIVNLTNIRPSRDQIMALNKGLSFIPTARNMTNKEVI